MSYVVTRKRVVNNNTLMAPVTSPTIPDVGWQHHSDGTDIYKYVFATWKSQIDENFPPVITGGGTINVIYWYIKTGSNGNSDYLVHCYAMLLGDDTTDALFNQTNPIDTVNGSAWTGDRSVSTTSGMVTITPKSKLSGQAFDRWIKLWGNIQFSGSMLEAPDHSAGGAVAVYSPAKKATSKFEFEEVQGFIQKIIDPGDLVADYANEFRDIIWALVNRNPHVEVQVKEAIAKLETLEPELIQKRQLEVRADIQRLEAMEKIIRTLKRGG